MADRAEALARQRALRQRALARQELHLFMRRLSFLLLMLVALLIAGTVGFALIEGGSLGFGFVRTVDTITTVGSISEPRDAGGQALKVGLELLGVGTLFYGFATVAEFFVSGELSGVLEQYRTQRMINSLSEHFIVCGFGRVGRQVARDLQAAGSRLVVIDDNPESRERAAALGVPHIDGPGSDDEVLKEAGIDRAAGVIACMDSDAENIFTTLTARELRSDIHVIARAAVEDSEKKLLRAGADRVVSPYKASGHEMARIALHPQIGGAVDVADYRVEEVDVASDCEGAGKTVAEVRGRSVILALTRSDGRLEPQPPPEMVIKPGDRLVALGTPEALRTLESSFQPVAGAAP